MNRKWGHGPVRAFTLIELLVVVAIIAVLISILLPSLNGAKRQARQLICGTNLKSLGEGMNFYAYANRNWIIRGLENISLGFSADGSCDKNYAHPIYQDTPTAILPYLNYSGMRDRFNNNPNLVYGIDNSGFNSLYCYLWSGDSEYSHEGTLQPLSITKAYNCPDYVIGQQAATSGNWTDSPCDYVASSFILPYSQKNIDYDAANLEWKPDGIGSGVPSNLADYVSNGRVEDIAKSRSPALFIFISEGNNQNSCRSVWFHHMFLTSHLPFGGFPRVAYDQRHPGGLVNLFYDGHVKALPLSSLDPGYPAPVGQRLRWWTPVYNDAYN